MQAKTAVLVLCALSAVAVTAEDAAGKKADPVFLRRSISEVQVAASDFTSGTCRYRPLFGRGDNDANVLKSVARFGDLTIDPGGASALVQFADEEQAIVVTEGAGILQYEGEKHPVRKNDFFYLPPGIRYRLSNTSAPPCRVIVMGFRIPEGRAAVPPSKLLLANLDDVPQQTVASHPPTTLYQLMMGGTTSKRDKLAAARVLTSLYVMEFAPSGTNDPHRHPREEEIYLVLNGHGDMVAGGSLEGREGRRPAKAGDAYFFGPGCTVGFYSGNKEGEEKARILAVRSTYPSP